MMSLLAKVDSPITLPEAYSLLSERGQSTKIIAGGTDLMVLMNAHLLRDSHFMNIWRLDELRGISDSGTAVRIGALTTYTELIRSKLIAVFSPSLVLASKTIGAIQIQNRGTIGGNIVNGSPAGDTLPVLAAYDAVVEIGSARGTRNVPFNEFYTGYRTTVIESDELVLAVRIPKLQDDERDFFWKVGTRRAQAISKIVMAIRSKVSGCKIERIAIGVGSVAPTVVRARETEELLAGKELNASLIEEARQKISQEVNPISDLRSNETYRRIVTGNVLAKFLRTIASTE